ncbi:MAG: phage gp6-like head-tail connector protein [Lysobacterales bacterium]|nr:MAG: phage gp6-like head-tail connector protein [Xanthomonadales bacterium]
MTLEFSRVTLPALWTVDQAKVHLRITGTAHDADIAQKLGTAQEAIVSYLAAAADPTWDATTAPKAVTHAIHLLTAYYYEDRGDGDLPDPWPKIYALLAAYRDPTVA